MKDYLRLGAFLVVAVAGFAAFAVVLGWAPKWAYEVVIGVGFATLVGDLWRRRIGSRARLSNQNLRLAIAGALVLGCAALSGWAIGVWTACAFVAALGIGDVHRRHSRAL